MKSSSISLRLWLWLWLWLLPPADVVEELSDNERAGFAFGAAGLIFNVFFWSCGWDCDFGTVFIAPSGLPEPLGSDGKSNGDFVSLTGTGLWTFGAIGAFSAGLAITLAALIWLYDPPGRNGKPNADAGAPDSDGKSTVELVILGAGLDGGGWLFGLFVIGFCDGFLNKAVAAFDLELEWLDCKWVLISEAASPPNAGKFSFVLASPLVPNTRLFNGAAERNENTGPLPKDGKSCSLRASITGLRGGGWACSCSVSAESSYLLGTKMINNKNSDLMKGWIFALTWLSVTQEHFAVADYIQNWLFVPDETFDHARWPCALQNKDSVKHVFVGRPKINFDLPFKSISDRKEAVNTLVLHSPSSHKWCWAKKWSLKDSWSLKIKSTFINYLNHVGRLV